MANSYGAGRRSVARQGSKDRGVAPVFRKLAAGVCCAAMCACCCVSHAVAWIKCISFTGVGTGQLVPTALGPKTRGCGQ